MCRVSGRSPNLVAIVGACVRGITIAHPAPNIPTVSRFFERRRRCDPVTVCLPFSWSCCGAKTATQIAVRSSECCASVVGSVPEAIRLNRADAYLVVSRLCQETVRSCVGLNGGKLPAFFRSCDEKKQSCAGTGCDFVFPPTGDNTNSVSDSP